MERYGMLMCGISDCDHNFSFVRRRSELAQILITLSGDGEVLADGKWQRLPTQSAYVTPLQVSHAYRCINNWRVAWVSYKTSDPFPHSYPQVFDQVSSDIEIFIEYILRESLAHDEMQTIQSLLQLLHSHVRRAVGADRSFDRLDRLWNHVHHDIAAHWSAKDMAKYINISEEHLRRLCHERFQKSPSRYLCELRMQHAAALLRGSDLNIGDIALQVGYDNAFAFSTAFKRWSTMPPFAYRKKN
ncbi:MAG: helix-turn-helix transcriptional regulator [Planctomycetes bacterium]|nr:helix-turn-helix transcriptional regulator [Planctomycetota bacterium]